MKIKLKPCPFCGSDVTFYDNGVNMIIGIQCRKYKACGMTAVFFKNGINVYADDKTAIAERWNKRAIG